MSLACLPDELLLQVIEKIDLRTILASVRMVSQRCRRIANCLLSEPQIKCSLVHIYRHGNLLCDNFHIALQLGPEPCKRYLDAGKICQALTKPSLLNDLPKSFLQDPCSACSQDCRLFPTYVEGVKPVQGLGWLCQRNLNLPSVKQCIMEDFAIRLSSKVIGRDVVADSALLWCDFDQYIGRPEDTFDISALLKVDSVEYALKRTGQEHSSKPDVVPTLIEPLVREAKVPREYTIASIEPLFPLILCCHANWSSYSARHLEDLQERLLLSNSDGQYSSDHWQQDNSSIDDFHHANECELIWLQIDLAQVQLDEVFIPAVSSWPLEQHRQEYNALHQKRAEDMYKPPIRGLAYAYDM